MRVVAYSIKNFEKEFLARANQKKHDITLISNPLSLETTIYAEGKEAVLVVTGDDLSAEVLTRLSELGIHYILTRSADTDYIDPKIAHEKNILVKSVFVKSPDSSQELLEMASQTILNLDQIQKNKFSEMGGQKTA